MPAGLAARSRAFERYLERALPAAATAPPTLHEALRYAALAPGKRVRPLLVLAACEAAGGDWRHALPAAAAVECVHAFSLVHDDLPAMDDDDYRRGRLTTHRKFGEAMGLLAGDALLALAFELITRLSPRTPAARVVQATSILARAAGSRELIGGQVLDLEAERRPASARGVRAIHERKTGALVSASLALGALVAGARPERRLAFERIGRELGVAFQIHDDLLNRESSLEHLGKRPGTDAARGKATWPAVVGEGRARADAARRFRGILRGLSVLGRRSQNLVALVQAVAERRN